MCTYRDPSIVSHASRAVQSDECVWSIGSLHRHQCQCHYHPHWHYARAFLRFRRCTVNHRWEARPLSIWICHQFWRRRCQSFVWINCSKSIWSLKPWRSASQSVIADCPAHAYRLMPLLMNSTKKTQHNEVSLRCPRYYHQILSIVAEYCQWLIFTSETIQR